MKLGRKLLFLGLCCCIGVGLAFGGAEQQGAAGGNVTLNLWHIYADESRGVPIEAAAKRFEAANPGVKVVISTYQNDPYKTKLKTVGKEDFPDVFHSWGGGWLKSFVDAGYVADMTAEANAAMGQLNKAAVELNDFGGKLYGVPYSSGLTILYYNKALFAKYGLQVPKTFSDLEKVANTFLANGITPFGCANLTKWPGAQYFVLASMRIGGGDIFTRASNKEVKFTDPVFIQAGQLIQDWVKKGWFPTGVNSLNWDTGQSRMLLYQEKCAMIVQTSGFMSTCKSENPGFYADKLGVALFPAYEGGKGAATDILGGENAFSVSASSKNVAMAKKLAIFLATDQEEQQAMLDKGVIAAKPGLTVKDPTIKEALDQLANATYFQNYIDQTLDPALAEVHKDTTQALFGGTMTPQQAAETMQKAFDSQ